MNLSVKLVAAALAVSAPLFAGAAVGGTDYRPARA